jgi:integrase
VNELYTHSVTLPNTLPRYTLNLMETKMAKTLTAAAVARLKPRADGKRREVPDGGCRGLHLVIEPSGTRSWGFRYRRPGSGKAANLRLGRVDLSGHEHDGTPQVGDPLSLAAARALAAECERQRLRGRDPAAEKQFAKRQARIVHAEREANTFAAAARQFCDEYKIPKKGKPRGWEQTARHLGLDYSEGEPALVPHGLAELWRDRLITEITGHDIYSVVDDATRRGIPGMKMRTEGISDARGRKMRDALGGMFGWLLKHRKITVDPCSGVWRPGSSAPRTRTLDNREVRYFWQAAGAVGESYAAALRLLLLTGCRLREIALLKWDEMPDNFSEIHLDGQRTKNGRPFTLPLPPLAQGILEGMPKIEGCDFVFSANGRTSGGSWNRVKARLDTLMLDLARKERGDGAEIEAWVLHDLRRTCASGMQQIGVRTEVIERCLNHTSGVFRGVSGIYQTDPLTDDVRAALERWARHVESIVTGKAAKVIHIDSRRA